MQFGIFSVSDITRDPVSGETPSEAERIDAIVRDRAEDRGSGAGRVRDRRAPQPAVLLVVADHAAGVHRGHHEEADRDHRDDADHHERPGAHRRGVRDAAAPVQGTDGPDARPRQHRAGVSVVRPGHPAGPAAGAGELQPAAPAVARGRGGLAGQVPHPAAGLHLDPAAAGRCAAVRVARLDPYPGDRRAGRVLRRRVLRQQHLLAQGALPAADQVLPAALRALRPRHRAAGHRRPGRPGVHRAELAGRQARSSGRTSTRRRSTGTARRWRTSWS